MYFRVEQLIVLLPICVMMSLDKNWNVATTERVSGQEDSTAMFGRPISYSRHTLFRYRRCHAVGMSKSTYIDILTERGLLRYRGTRGGQAARARREARLRSKPEANRSVEKPELTSISDQIGLMAGNNNIPVIISRQESYDQRSHQSNFSLADRISTLVYPKRVAVSTVYRSMLSQRPLPTLYVFNSASLAKANAVDQLAADLVSYHIDIGFITETHLKSSKHTDKSMNIDGYVLFRRDRSKRRGGGVAFYISSKLAASEIHIPGDNYMFEVLWLSVQDADFQGTVGVVYHPPRPTYHTNDLLEYIEICIDYINSQLSSGLIIVAGDFNGLPEQQFIDRTGLTSIVDQPTRGRNCLDKIYVSEPSYTDIRVVSSAVKSDHRAVIAWDGSFEITDLHKTKAQHQYRARTPDQHAAFLLSQSHSSWEDVLCETDVQKAFDAFYDRALTALDIFYPVHCVTLSNRDPHFVTPRIKSLLRQRNRLMRKGSVAAANSLTDRIGKGIAAHNHSVFVDTKRGSRDMWKKVQQVTGRPQCNRKNCFAVDVENLNDHFAGISTDQYYQTPEPKSTVSQNLQLFTEYQVFRMLDTVKPTAFGLDGLPDWFIRLAAPVFAQPLTHLFNLSLEQSVVPSQWKLSCITPIAKVSKPRSCSDYRPISVTPIISRIMEKFLVKSLLYPVITEPECTHSFVDQFAFRPTGSTTAALISIFQQITNLLQKYDYVHLISLDFSKAFDSVRHHSLISKLAQFPLPDCFYNWVIHYLSARKHQTKAGNVKSAFRAINASIIQGSGIGPVSYVFTACDLHALHSPNILLKYADDTYLLVPAPNSALIQQELDHVSQWASANNLNLNSSKSCEMVIYLPSKKPLNFPPSIPNLTRVDHITALGITFNNILSCEPHVNLITPKAAASLYALKTLKSHGLSGPALWDVARATLVAQITYASPSWRGFINADELNKLQTILNKAKRSNFLPFDFSSLEELFDSADSALFGAVLHNPQHVLYSLLPPRKKTGYNLRKLSHGLTLPDAKTSFIRKNFFIRMLYMDVY